MMNRRGILRGALASAAVLAAGGGTGCAARELLRVAYHLWPGYAPLELARSLDWWEEAAVQALRTGSASASLQALREGSVAAAALTLDEVIGARHQGLPLRVMGILDISLGADQVLARPSHADPAQWRGVRLGHENNAVGELMAVAWLQAAGLQASDVQMVHVPFDRHEAAWYQHEVDLLVTFEPTAGRLRHRGAVPIFDSAQLPAPWTIVDVLAVHARFAAGRHTPPVARTAGQRVGGPAAPQRTAGRQPLPTRALARRAARRGLRAFCRPATDQVARQPRLAGGR